MRAQAPIHPETDDHNLYFEVVLPFSDRARWLLDPRCPNQTSLAAPEIQQKLRASLADIPVGGTLGKMPVGMRKERRLKELRGELHRFVILALPPLLDRSLA